jgi:hypothetical protein
MKQQRFITVALYLFCSLSLAQPASHPQTTPPQTTIKNIANHAPSLFQYRHHLLKKLTQGLDDPLSPFLINPHCRIGGLANFDVLYQSQPNLSNQRDIYFALSALQFNTTLFPTPWLQAHLGLFYASNEDYYYANTAQKEKPMINTAYFTLSNFKKSGWFLRGGRQFLAFGRYKRYPVIPWPRRRKHRSFIHS